MFSKWEKNKAGEIGIGFTVGNTVNLINGHFSIRNSLLNVSHSSNKYSTI